MDEKTALLYAKLNPYKALVNKTSGFIRWALDRVENPYVACSFGKDSAVMLHLILQHKKDIRVLFAVSDETFVIDNYDEVIKLWGDINLSMLHCSRETDGRTHSSSKMSNYFDYDSYFVGIRAEESKNRRMSLKYQGLFYKKKDNKVRISPLADWTDKDIIAYIYANKLPLLDTYKVFSEKARTSSAVPTIGRERMLSMLQKRDINAFNKLNEILKDQL